ncbi:MAG: membrane protein insertion efficiency factor YidD [Candidatus Zixiibacteriota bacterium]|nr:MAG: membrane protein insertion efficiency factor YidD [candidate division Zixibacteria bacterium]
MDNRKISIFSYPLILIIHIYRYTLSPLIGNQCRFYPTCSHYAEEAVKKHGAFRGLIMAIRRLFRCHPWHEGGYDPVPDEIPTGKLTERSFG